jgi:serine/threonine protein kinase/Flp pilus assembly protein TadD
LEHATDYPDRGESDAELGSVEVLAEEFLERQRRGERPEIAEYTARYPELADRIRAFFPALLHVERLKADQGGSTSCDGDVPRGVAPERLGDYRILREVGRGGMGVVYEAEQESLGRRVALKILAGHGPRNPKQLLRFHREARAAARLHHTNIVPVFGVGESEGQHYYVMQFIPGLGLDAVLEELKGSRGPNPEGRSAGTAAVDRMASTAAELARSLRTERFPTAPTSGPSEERPVRGPASPAPASESPSLVVLPGQSGGASAPDSAGRYARSVAMIGVQVAEALDYAHRQGVLHRDVKPSNLLLDGQGTVWVADFGLAKAADSDDLTRTGDIVGTVRYMAPERFEGRCDVRSDVYALGLTLYELLALRPAFEKADRAELIYQVTHEEPPPLRGLDASIPRDLETVVRKAIEREPGRRYGDAEALAEDLRRFVEGRPIQARRVSPLEHAWRWCRRNPAWAALAATVLVLVGLAVAWRGEVERRQARREPARQAFVAALNRAADWRGQGLWSEARDVLDRAEALLDDAGAPGLRERLRLARADLELAARLERNAIARMELLRGKLQYPAVAAEYAEAFRAAGLAAADEAADVEEVAAHVGASAIRERLVAGLDDWSIAAAEPRLRSRLLRIARRVDPDPGWRDRVRDPAVRGDRGALERLAAEVLEPAGVEQPPQLLLSLAGALEEVKGDPTPLLRAVQRRRPGDFWLNYALGRALARTRPSESVGFLRVVLALRPQDVRVHNDLSWSLWRSDQQGEAVAISRRAVALDPTSATAHCGLGNALFFAGRAEEGLAAQRRAIELDPALAAARLGEANALLILGRPDEALEPCLRAVELDQGKTSAYHHVLGNTLAALGRIDDAAAAYRRSIEIDPKAAEAHYGLGQILQLRGDRDEAIAKVRLAMALDGEHVGYAPVALGEFLRIAGRYDEAASVLRRHRERVLGHPERVEEVDGELARVGRDTALAPRCSAVLRGDDRPADPSEGLEFARMAYERRLHSAAARLFAGALAADPRLVDDPRTLHRYRAACAAAQAGCGAGKGEPVADESARAAMRERALGWLRAELAAWSNVDDSGRPAVAATLRQWRRDPDLAVVRARDALARLPAPERAAWQAFWVDVDAINRGAPTGGARSPGPPPGELPADPFAR